MKVLNGCEESQAVTIEMRKLGIDAYSCDLEPCSGGHPEWHLQMDVFEAIKLKEWDMGIFFPPCTHLAVSGAAHFAAKRADGRQQESVKFFKNIYNCSIPVIAVENPLGIMSTELRKPDQIIQPWQFGDEAQKATCLWLKGLPLLLPTKIVSKGEFFKCVNRKTGKEEYRAKFSQYAGPSPERAKMRSKTFPGIAKAMAEQWTK